MNFLAKKQTPMMEQYQKVKDQYPDAFLFYRLGDFYELFNEDAVKGAQLLELTLTTRNHSAKNLIPMCGVPHRAVESYVDVLIDKGYKVAICEQMEDPKKAKGMVKRAVTRLITPGTQMDLNGDQARQNNYLAAISQADNQFNLAYTDLSTGELKTTSLGNVEGVVNELINLQSKEVVGGPARPPQSCLGQPAHPAFPAGGNSQAVGDQLPDPGPDSRRSAARGGPPGFLPADDAKTFSCPYAAGDCLPT